VQLANPDTGVIIRKAHVSQVKRLFGGMIMLDIIGFV
jgi:hypothetical protein